MSKYPKFIADFATICTDVSRLFLRVYELFDSFIGNHEKLKGGCKSAHETDFDETLCIKCTSYMSKGMKINFKKCDLVLDFGNFVRFTKFNTFLNTLTKYFNGWMFILMLTYFWTFVRLLCLFKSSILFTLTLTLLWIEWTYFVTRLPPGAFVTFCDRLLFVQKQFP